MAFRDTNKRIRKYQKTYTDNYTFEAKMVHYRQQSLLDLFADLKPRSVVEIGCGQDLLYDRVCKIYGNIESWIIVEPAPFFSAIASKKAEYSAPLIVINDFVETAIDRIKSSLTRPLDLCIISGVLHEVEDPSALLEAVSRFLSHKTIVHANVPNAYSLHRRLAKAMGMINDEHELNLRNRALEQYTVFDNVSFPRLFEEAGYAVTSTGGYMIKPFTHEQMTAMNKIITDAMLAGFYVLGQEMPELAAEIFVTARR